MQFRHAPEGRTFSMIHNNAQDFFFYQSLMNEGANGAWLTSDPYTSEPHQSSIIFSYFLWLGKLSQFLGLPYAITYHLVRIILGIFLLFFAYHLLFFLKIPYPCLTYLFFLFAAPFMHTLNDGGKITSVPFMNWWTGMDPIRRVAYLPHHMAGGLFLVMTIITIIKFMRSHRSSYLFWAIIFVPILAFIHTPSLLILLLILPPTLIAFILIIKPSKIPIFKGHGLNAGSNRFIIRGDTWRDAHAKAGGEDRNLRKLGVSLQIGIERAGFGLLVYWAIGLFFLFVMILQTKSGFPWSQYIDWEKKLQFPLDKELIGALGILFPFSILGAWQAIRSKKFESILIVCWLFVPFLFIPLASKIGLSNIRLIQGVPYLPLSILAIYGIKTIESFIKQPKISILKTEINAPKIRAILGADTWRDAFAWAKGKHRNLDKAGVSEKFGIKAAVIGLFLILIFSFTFPAFKWSLQDQIREYWPIFGNVYLDNRLNNAFAFINQNYPPKTIVLSTFYTGNYLPAFTRTVSYIGHFGYTYNVAEKEKKVMKFFEGNMKEEEAKEFLTSNKITLIWHGPEEKPIYSSYLYPKILKPVYDKEEVTIYTEISN